MIVFLSTLFLGACVLAVFFASMCVMLGRDNDKLRRVAWSRLKTSIRLRQLRRLQQQLEEYVNADEVEVEELAGRNWRAQ